MGLAKAPSDCPLHYRHNRTFSPSERSLSDASHAESAPIILVKDKLALGPALPGVQCTAVAGEHSAAVSTPGGKNERLGFMSRAEISYRIQAAAMKMTAGQRLSDALDTIDTIPEQLDDVLQHKVDNLATNVEIKLGTVRQMIHRTGESVCAEQALRQLKAIPEIILSSFEGKIIKVKNSVRQRVNVLYQELTDNDLGAAHIVCQLWTLPEEVQQIAREAVEEAVQESKEQATQQLNSALQSLQIDALEHAVVFTDAKQQIIEEVPGVCPETVEAARATAVASVEHAIAAVGSGCAVPNRVVVDVLFQAKKDRIDSAANSMSLGQRCSSKWKSRGSSPDSREELSSSTPRSQGDAKGQTDAGEHLGADDPMTGNGVRENWEGAVSAYESACGEDLAGSACHANPGSMGHPQLCSRPCLYFRLDQCTKGSACSFCHHPHVQRIAHLGRRHRKMLEGLPFKERLTIMLPVLESRLQVLGIPADLMSMLGGKEGDDGGSQQGSSQALTALDSEKRRHFRLKDTRCLERALRALTLRSLLTVLLHPPESCQEHITFENVIERLRSESRAVQ
mmetsp:Transcript_71990/g.166696  ORF Transcript_71990/g.166696 Transcript_71990/m.166696 type:complete len:567 (+) Transcript_71990:97-1797(+)